VSDLTLDGVIEILGEIVDLSGVTVTAEAVLGDDVPLDSREMLRVLSRIESRYRFRFAPGDAFAMRTVGDVVTIARRRCG